MPRAAGGTPCPTAARGDAGRDPHWPPTQTRYRVPRPFSGARRAPSKTSARVPTVRIAPLEHSRVTAPFPRRPHRPQLVDRGRASLRAVALTVHSPAGPRSASTRLWTRQVADSAARSSAVPGSRPVSRPQPRSGPPGGVAAWRQSRPPRRLSTPGGHHGQQRSAGHRNPGARPMQPGIPAGSQDGERHHPLPRSDGRVDATPRTVASAGRPPDQVSKQRRTYLRFRADVFTGGSDPRRCLRTPSRAYTIDIPGRTVSVTSRAPNPRTSGASGIRDGRRVVPQRSRVDAGPVACSRDAIPRGWF